MKNLILSTILLIIILVSFFGCGSSTVNLSKTDSGEIPIWFLTPPNDPNNDTLFSAKTATSRDMQIAIDKATTDARTEISRQIEVNVQGLQKKFDEEVGLGEDSQLLSQFTQASKTVVSQSLIGSKVKDNKIIKDGNTWRSYVLVEYPLGAAKKLLLDKIKENEQLYTRFRASETFKELENEVQRIK